MRPKISIVVPVYNVKNYLNRCVNSIVKQTYKNLEIILVDDGSPDKCPEMCDNWAIKDPRIKVIHKKNAGLGMARNTGIDHATGKYICFFDSDDYIALDTIEKCYNSAQKYHSDIVMFGMNSVSASGKIVSSDVPDTDKEYYSGNEITEYILPNMIAADPRTGRKLYLNMSSSGRMYLLSIIEENHWRFASEREYISEDFYSLLILYHYVNSVSVVKEAFYYYCYNNTSLTHSFRSDRYERVCHCYSGMLEVCDRYGYSDAVKTCLDSQFLGSVIATMKLIVISNASLGEKLKQISLIVNDKYLEKVLQNMDIKNETKPRRIIIWALKEKMCYLVFFLIKAKS